MTQKKHNRLPEEEEPTVHLAEIQAMLDDGLPVYIEINTNIQSSWLYDLAIYTEIKTMAGDLIKLTRDSITDILGIPMISAQNYLWSMDTFRAIIPVEEAGDFQGCSKCAFYEHSCHGINCFNHYYEYRKVITDGHKVVEEVEEEVYTMDFVRVSTSKTTCDGCAFHTLRPDECSIPKKKKRPCTLSSIMKFKE